MPFNKHRLTAYSIKTTTQQLHLVDMNTNLKFILYKKNVESKKKKKNRVFMRYILQTLAIRVAFNRSRSQFKIHVECDRKNER